MSQTIRRLFGHQDLTDLIQSAVDQRAANMAERIVWGWLKPVLDLDERPDPVPDEVFSWAILLGAIALENPTGLSTYELGDEKSQYSAEARDKILEEAAAGGHVSSSAPATPLGCFPPAQPWPDPIRVGANARHRHHW